MRKLFGILLAVSWTGTALLIGGPASAAGNAMRMTWTPGAVSVDFNPLHVAQRCPTGWAERGGGLVTATGGSGELTYQGRTISVTVDQSHCSLPRPHEKSVADLLARTVTPIDIEAGQMAITSASGELDLTYRAPGVFKGDLTFVGYNLHTFNGPYAITGGTHEFASATGNGHLHGFAEGGEGAPVTGGEGTLNGSLRLGG